MTEKFEDRRVWDTDDEEYDDSADDDFRKQSMHSLRSFDDVSLESSSSGLEFKFSHNDVTTGGLEVNSSNNDITNYESDENPSYADVTVVESRLCSHHDDVTTAGTGMSTCNDDVYVDVVNSCHGDISGVEIKIESNDVARKDNEGLGGDRTQPTGQFDSEIHYVMANLKKRRFQKRFHKMGCSKTITYRQVNKRGVKVNKKKGLL